MKKHGEEGVLGGAGVMRFWSGWNGLKRGAWVCEEGVKDCGVTCSNKW